jgi:hypothetical protein
VIVYSAADIYSLVAVQSLKDNVIVLFTFYLAPHPICSLIAALGNCYLHQILE